MGKGKSPEILISNSTRIISKNHGFFYHLIPIFLRSDFWRRRRYNHREQPHESRK